MRVLPLLFAQFLTDSELEEYECSDRIWVPKQVFERWVRLSEPGIAMLARLENAVGQNAVGVIQDVHYDDDDVLYVPQWMAQRLTDSDDVSLDHYEPNLCMGLTIQPHTSDHVLAADPQVYLRDAFERYSCLIPGQTVPLWVGPSEQNPTNHTMYVDITSLRPSGDEPLCIRNCEIELELLPPLDTPIPSPPLPESPPPMTPELPEPPMAPPLAAGHVLGGAMPAGRSARELAAEAALRRAAQASKPTEPVNTLENGSSR
jgi:hypothetical protein